MEANRDESVRCLNLAQYAYRLEGDRQKAMRLAIRSNQLYPSQMAQDLLKVFTMPPPPATADGNKAFSAPMMGPIQVGGLTITQNPAGGSGNKGNAQQGQSEKKVIYFILS